MGTEAQGSFIHLSPIPEKLHENEDLSLRFKWSRENLETRMGRVPNSCCWPVFSCLISHTQEEEEHRNEEFWWERSAQRGHRGRCLDRTTAWSVEVSISRRKKDEQRAHNKHYSLTSEEVSMFSYRLGPEQRSNFSSRLPKK